MFKKPENIFLVGLTGGIATGKSLAAEFLKSSGIIVLDVDEILREETVRGKPLFDKIVNAFGNGILLENGEIDRKLLAAVIFDDPGKRALLESLTHPALFEILGSRLEAISAGFAGYEQGKSEPGRTARHPVVVEVPLLFETGAGRFMDLTVVISCPLEDQIRRLMKRDRLSAEEAKRRVSLQMPLSKKESMSDIVIKNEGSRELLKEKTGQLINVIFSSLAAERPAKQNLII